MTNVSNKLLRLALLCLSPHLTPQASIAKEEEEIEPIAWPAETPIPGIVEHFSRHSEGITEKLYRVRTADLDFVLSPFGSWQKGSAKARESARFSSTENTLSFGISSYPRQDFLPNLNQSTWKRYTSYLQRQFPQYEIVEEQSNLDSSGGLYVLGHKYRQIKYNVPMANERIKQVQEIFFLHEDNLHVFIFEGLLEDMERQHRNRRLFLSRMGFTVDE